MLAELLVKFSRPVENLPLCAIDVKVSISGKQVVRSTVENRSKFNLATYVLHGQRPVNFAVRIPGFGVRNLNDLRELKLRIGKSLHIKKVVGLEVVDQHLPHSGVSDISISNAAHVDHERAA